MTMNKAVREIHNVERRRNRVAHRAHKHCLKFLRACAGCSGQRTHEWTEGQAHGAALLASADSFAVVPSLLAPEARISL